MKRTIRKHKKREYRQKIGSAAALFMLAILAVSGWLYAKYYAQESRKAVTTASGLYFSSNCLSNVQELDAEHPETFPSYVDSNQWNGAGAATLPIQIYNYDNILLYNDQNLNITYDIYFCLLDDDDAEYSISYEVNGTAVTQTLKKGETVTLKDQYLRGGSAVRNTVTLKVAPNTEIDRDTYISGRVAVWAIPTYPDYVVNAYQLAACIQMMPTKGDFEFTSAFTIADSVESAYGKDELSGQKLLNEYVGFVYNIRTTGEMRGTTHYFEITWNSNVLEIDSYNTYYLEAVNNGTIVDNGDGTKTMVIEALPYASMNISFYKTPEFKSENFSDADSFNGLVTIVDLQQ